jgi:hypothetical protein
MTNSSTPTARMSELIVSTMFQKLTPMPGITR